jgi:hypothetical protein
LVYIVGNIIVHSVDELKQFELEVIELKQGEPDVPGRTDQEGGQAVNFLGPPFFQAHLNTN